MKKIFISTIFTLWFLFSFGQTDSSRHLSFKGIPINGTLNSFVSKVKLNEFHEEPVPANSNYRKYNMEFAGYEDCELTIESLKHMDLVYKVSIIIPGNCQWSNLYESFSNLKNMLREKYGPPSEDVEKFNVNSDSLTEIKNDVLFGEAAKFYSIWNTKKGNIQLNIDNNGQCSMHLSYTDKINDNINREMIKKRALEDL